MTVLKQRAITANLENLKTFITKMENYVIAE